MPRALHAEDGFVLLDALIGIAIAGMALTATIGFVAFLAQADTRIERRSGDVDRILEANRVLNLLVRTMVLTPSKPFSGTPGEISFFSNVPRTAGADDPLEVHIACSRNGPATDLEVRFATQDGVPRGPTRLRLPGKASFSFFEAASDRSASDWSDRFQNATGTPLAIKLHVESDTHPSGWDIVAVPGPASTAACQFAEGSSCLTQ